MNEQTDKEIILTRDVDAILIPQGIPMPFKKGETVTITQNLGGSITIFCNGYLARITQENFDALGMDKDNPTQDKSIDNILANKDITGDGTVNIDDIWLQLKTCYDPEIPVNIVDLGLIYDVKTTVNKKNGSTVDITMTLTAPGCGMGPFIVEDVRNKIAQIDNVKAVNVELTWEPLWNADMMTEEAKLQLGLL